MLCLQSLGESVPDGGAIKCKTQRQKQADCSEDRELTSEEGRKVQEKGTMYVAPL